MLLAFFYTLIVLYINIFYKKLKLKKTHYIFLILILFFASCGVKTQKISKNKSEIDLFDTNFDDETVFALQNSWNFYWDTLLTPIEIQTTNLKPELVKVPNTWNDYGYPNKGKATYNIKIKVPANRFYALKFRRIFLSSKIWINNEFAFEIGKVANNKKDFIPNDLTKHHVFYTDTNVVDITIQVSNYIFRKAGITNDVKLGSTRAIERLSYGSLLYEVFIIGALAFMMLFYFILFFYNKKVVSNLYFSLFLLFEVITLGLDGELFFLHVFPDIGWVLASKAWNIASYLRPLFLMLFIEGLTRKYFSQRLKKVAIYFVIAISIFIAFVPVQVYTHTIILFIVFALGTLLYEIIVTIRTFKHRKSIAYALTGLILILLTTLNDSLYDYGVIKSFYSVGLGVFVFAILQAFLLSLRNAELFEKAENLTSSVEIQNRLKEALLSTPSYDIGESLYAFVKTVGIEKILIFSVEKEQIFLSNLVEKDKIPQKLETKINLDEENELFYSKAVKSAFFENKETFLSNKNKISIPLSNDKYIDHNIIKNIIAIPITEKDKTIAVIYIENRSRMLNNAQQSVLKSASSQFYNIINTAVAYFRLQEMNEYLEDEVKKRTTEVEKQKHEIDHKNQELDEKIQLLEEQYIIQQEINDELENQNEELESQNKQLSEQNEEISQQKTELEKHNKLISDNIKYASAILSALKQVEENGPFRKWFWLDKPRDIVSGDFLWSKSFGDKFIFTLADSTGHGVPGALMSLLGIRLINKAVTHAVKNTENFTSADILNTLRDTIKKQLTEENQALKDGFDMSFCIFDKKTNKLNIAGAYNPLFIVRNNELMHIKGDRMPIGSYIEGFEKPFKNQTIDLVKDDIVYLFTDGYIDQFGGVENTKFYMANFKKLILEISAYDLDKQFDILNETFEKWRKNNSQIDDVSVAGFQL